MKKQFISGFIILALGTVFSTNVLAEADLNRGEANYKVCMHVTVKMVVVERSQMHHESLVNKPGI